MTARSSFIQERGENQAKRKVSGDRAMVWNPIGIISQQR